MAKVMAIVNLVNPGVKAAASEVCPHLQLVEHVTVVVHMCEYTYHNIYFACHNCLQCCDIFSWVRGLDKVEGGDRANRPREEEEDEGHNAWSARVCWYKHYNFQVEGLTSRIHLHRITC